ncbi:MAG: hypothetical protein IPH07_14225 [Deltaproteobacteria bacterium]|nr:hypothetical protein [Deltaproteobacteria bacterium]
MHAELHVVTEVGRVRELGGSVAVDEERRDVRRALALMVFVTRSSTSLNTRVRYLSGVRLSLKKSGLPNISAACWRRSSRLLFTGVAVSSSTLRRRSLRGWRRRRSRSTVVRRAPTERKLCASSTTTRSDRSRCSMSLMPARPRVRTSLDGTMRESFECEMTRMVASGTPCAARGAMASRCQVLTTELGESTVIRNGSSVAERFASASWSRHWFA